MDNDVPVIHFEIPDKTETYITRLQHLLSPEKHNAAITLLATHAEHDNLKKLEEFLGEKLESRNITGLEPKQKSRSKKPGGKSDGRKPQPRKAGGAQANRGRKTGGPATSDKQQRTRKGPYGRNGGAKK